MFIVCFPQIIVLNHYELMVSKWFTTNLAIDKQFVMVKKGTVDNIF